MGLAEDEFGGVEKDKEGPKMQEESESLQFPLDQEQPSESDDSLFENQSETKTRESPLVHQQIVKLTDNFALTYKDIRESQMLREPPFNALTIADIRAMIKNGRR